MVELLEKSARRPGLFWILLDCPAPGNSRRQGQDLFDAQFYVFQKEFTMIIVAINSTIWSINPNRAFLEASMPWDFPVMAI
jgi:hypothetical protein